MKKHGIITILITLISTIVCILLIMDSENMINAAKTSVNVCLNVIIPSLFAFMVFSQLLVKSGAAEIMFYPLYIISKFWFRGTRREFSIFILSLIGGYPVGIKLLKEEIAYNKNFTAIAEKMLCYCYCGSPAFIIQVAGLSVLGSSKAGLFAYAANVLACITAAVLLNIFLKNKETYTHASLSKAKISLAHVTESINGSVKSLGVICGTIISFNIIIELLNYCGFMDILDRFDLKKIFCAFFEISNLSMFQGNDFEMLPLFSAVTSFGGLCIIMQTAALSQGKLRLKRFILSRIPIAALSAVYCRILTLLFPLYIESGISAASTVPVFSSVNPICSVCLIIMTFILLKESGEKIKS